MLRPVAADLTTTIRAAETPVRLHQDELVWMVAGRCIVGARFSSLILICDLAHEPAFGAIDTGSSIHYNDGIGLVVVRRSARPAHEPPPPRPGLQVENTDT